jgi:hypothetical protein
MKSQNDTFKDLMDRFVVETDHEDRDDEVDGQIYNENQLIEGDSLQTV